MTNSPTSTGLQENVASLLCYVLGWVTGIIFYILEHKNNVIRFHGAQSIVVFGAASLVTAILGWIPIFGWIISTIIWIIGFLLWILLMLKAYQGGIYRLPIAAPIADSLDNWLTKTFKL